MRGPRCETSAAANRDAMSRALNNFSDARPTGLRLAWLDRRRGRRVSSRVGLALIALGLAAPAWLCARSPALAAEPGGLSLTSDGSLGDVSSYFIYNYNSFTYTLNTNNGYMYQGNSLIDPLASNLVTQSDGSQVRVWDFSTFTVAPDITLNITGSLPGAIVASGGITVNGAINVSAGGGTGASGAGIYAPGNPAPGPTGGGGGGAWSNTVVRPPTDGTQYTSTQGGGGGGGSATPGQNGVAGLYTVKDATYGTILTQTADTSAPGGAGGNAFSNPNILQGGGGGGGGGGCAGGCGGGPGANGGGGLLFVTPGNLSIGSMGSITANGANGPFYDEGAGGAGGGGAGMLWFNAGGVFTNNGMITATGGAPGQADGCCSTPPSYNSGEGGAGAGGLVDIDPSQIINNGLIDVADGNGLTTDGGDVICRRIP